MSFQQGLSGLNAASKNLEAIGNNVANSSTVGFKGSQAQFSDVYAASLTGAGGANIGIGTQLTSVVQQFTQGNITASNSPLDVAINGGGFFRLNDNGAITYSRNGQFQLDKEGFVVNASGLRLTGYAADIDGVLSTGAPADISISSADLAPSTTSEVRITLNLDSRNAQPATIPFNQTDPSSYNSSSSVTVFDSLGNSHVLQTFYVRTAAAGQWDVYATADGVPVGYVPPAAPVAVGTLNFTSAGLIDAATTTLPFPTSIALTNGATSPLSFDMEFTESTQYGSAFRVTRLTQDGYTSGGLSGFTIGQDGMISGRYSNGKTSVLGQVVLANFTNPNGLVPLGSNTWGETASSGQPLVGTPSSGNLGVLQSSAVEDSNVDLTAELVNMITAQRVYQANAQTIKTHDQVLQTLVNLR